MLRHEYLATNIVAKQPAMIMIDAIKIVTIIILQEEKKSVDITK